MSLTIKSDKRYYKWHVGQKFVRPDGNATYIHAYGDELKWIQAHGFMDWSDDSLVYSTNLREIENIIQWLLDQ